MTFGQGITILPGGKVTVLNGGELKATGSMGITVKSDATGTGSFLDQNSTNGNVTFNGTQTVERYISGETKYHIFSSPVQTATFGSIFASNQMNIWVREFIETSNAYVNRIFNESAEQGKGYTIYLDGIASTTATFSGTLGTGSIAIGGNLTGIDITGPGNGWNMAGNPYPSAISWNAITKSNLLASVYAWNASGGNWYSYNGTAGTLTDGVIPSGQGFFVQVTGSSPTLTFTNACRVHGGSTLYYKSASIQNLLTIGVTTSMNLYYDKVYIYFDPGATNGFDPMFDAYKFRGEAEAPEIFTTGDPILSIDVRRSIEDSPVIPLGFKAGSAAEYTFSAEGMESFSSGTPIILEDKMTGAMINLRQNSSYAFHSVKGEFFDRFNVRFSTVGVEETLPSEIQVYSIDKTIYLSIPHPAVGTVKVYNLVGQYMAGSPLLSQKLLKIPVEGVSGIYVVSVLIDNTLISKKIMIK